MPKLTKTIVDKAQPEASRYVIWDTEIRGFGLYISPNGVKRYYLKYRTLDGISRKPKIGDHGSITVAQARKIASEWANDVRNGRDPSRTRKNARRISNMKDLANRYIEEYAKPYKKPSSVRMDTINIQVHVLPALGTRKITDVSHADIVKLHQNIGKKSPGAANRVVALLSKMFNLAEKWDLRKGINPCKHLVKFKERKIERYLTPEEYKNLFQAIKETVESRQIEPLAGAALQLLALTGCRVGEIISLKWNDFDQRTHELILRDSKTGARRLPLGEDAFQILKNMWVQGLENSYDWFFSRPGRRAEPITYFWLRVRWYRVRKRAGLSDLRMHDLRHGFASIAASEGYSLLTIGTLLGHKIPSTTFRYTHLISEPLHAAARKINAKIGASMI